MNEYRRILGVPSIQPGLSTAMWTDRYSSCNSPYRYGAWTISSSLGFNEGALRMASEDSDYAVHSALEMWLLKLATTPPSAAPPAFPAD
jgi:hypothetical protein